MDFAKVTVITQEVIDQLNKRLTKKESLINIIKSCESVNADNAKEVDQARNDFLKLLNEAGYKRNKKNKRYELVLKEENKEKDTLEITQINDDEPIKKPRKRRTKKEIKIDEMKKNSPYGSVSEFSLNDEVHRSAKSMKEDQKALGTYIYGSVLEKFKVIEEDFYYVNNNLIMDAILNHFIIHKDKEIVKEYEEKIGHIKMIEKKSKKQITWKISSFTMLSLEFLTKDEGKFHYLSKSEIVNIALFAYCDRYIIENKK